MGQSIPADAPCPFCQNGVCQQQAAGPPSWPGPAPVQPGQEDLASLERMLQGLSEIDRQEKADLFFNEGEMLFRRREFLRALNEYLKAQKANPGYVKAFERAGDIYFLFDRYNEAIDQYKTLLRLDGSRGDIWMRLLLQYRFAFRGANQESMCRSQVQRYQNAMEKDPENPMTHFALGLSYLVLPMKEPRTTLRQKALDQFKRMVTLDPDNLWGFWGQKYAHLFMGQDRSAGALEEARLVCLEAIQKSRPGVESARAFWELGECYELIAIYGPEERPDALERAKEEYRKAWVLSGGEGGNFDNPNAHLRLGILEKQEYAFEVAIRHPEPVVENEPFDFYATLELARLQRDLGMDQEAISC